MGSHRQGSWRRSRTAMSFASNPSAWSEALCDGSGVAHPVSYGNNFTGPFMADDERVLRWPRSYYRPLMMPGSSRIWPRTHATHYVSARRLRDRHLPISHSPGPSAHGLQWSLEALSWFRLGSQFSSRWGEAVQRRPLFRNTSPPRTVKLWTVFFGTHRATPGSQRSARRLPWHLPFPERT